MKFIDTREGKILDINSYEAILAGKIGEGLITPAEEIKQFSQDELLTLNNLSFSELASKIINRIFTDITEEEIFAFCKKAYSDENFDDPEILPVYDYHNGFYSIEQWHGKTAAFKDIPLSVLPLFIEEALKRENEKNRLNRKILMLGATSGDTGSAGEAGMKNIQNVLVAVMYPEKGKVTYVQKLQMIDNQTADYRVSAYAITDNFDFCQNQVLKPLLDDKDFRQTLLNKYSIITSSLNSINIGRIAPQIASYFQIYRKIGNQEFDICVPTGNFGHILSAYFAKKMGLPIRKLIVATNINDVLHRFIQTGLYKPHDFQTTYSPSMDIAISSNAERMLYHITDGDHVKVKKWFTDLKEKGEFQVDEITLAKIQEIFDSETASEEETLAQIKKCWIEHKRILDPHSAVAMAVAEKKKKSGVPMAFCETAHWGKFVATIYDALGLEKPEKEAGEWEIKAMEDIEKMILENSGTPKNTRFLRALAETNKKPFKSGIHPSPDEMKNFIFEQIKGI